MAVLYPDPFLFGLIHNLLDLMVWRGIPALHQCPNIDLIFKYPADRHGTPLCLLMRLKIVLDTDAEAVLVFHW